MVPQDMNTEVAGEPVMDGGGLPGGHLGVQVPHLEWGGEWSSIMTLTMTTSTKGSSRARNLQSIPFLPCIPCSPKQRSKLGCCLGGRKLEEKKQEEQKLSVFDLWTTFWADRVNKTKQEECM